MLENGSFYHREAASATYLEAEEEQELVRSANRGSSEDRNRLISSHVRLVVKIARQYSQRVNCSLDDLVQEGSLGLIQAADKYDVKRSNRFSTYAIWWIRHFIQRYIDKNYSIIRLPYRKVQKMRKEWSLEGGRENHQTVEGSEKKDSWKFDHIVVSTSDETIFNVLCDDEDCVEEKLFRQELCDLEKDMLDVLNEEEFTVIYSRFYTAEKKVSVRLISEKLRIPEHSVRRRIKRAFEKMKSRAMDLGFMQ